MRGKRYETEKKLEGRPSITNSCESVTKLGHSDQVVFDSTASKIAAQTNTSPRTIRRDAQFARAVDDVKHINPSFSQKLLTEDIKVTKKDVVELSKKPEDDKKAPGGTLRRDLPG